MIDEKGRLFGKVNIVDLLIIVIVLAAAAFIGMKVLGPDSTAANTQNVRITMFCEESPTFVVDQLEAGCEAWDSANQVTLGTLVDWTTGDSMSAITDANGEVVEIAREGYRSVRLVCEGTGVVSDRGVTIGGVLYGVGQSASVYFGNCKLFLDIAGIEVIG